ncbi:phospholipid-transporting ATPase ABCA3-like [Haemaphysalis longicornis]
MKGPTSGTARVCGYNAATKRDEIRRIVSLCQQFDIFFEDLTCIENLLYFGSLKGSNMEKLRQAIVNTLKVVNLEEKTHSMPSELSGGMKRRLSMAIAIVSNPKIVILDEPTTGMDPETRRNVWDVIQILGKQHTVLLSSHDMEEADAIGDYIIVMALGKAVCAGSTAFLKKACGVGYKIALAKAPSGFNLAGALAEIHKAAPNAEVEDEKQGEVVIALRTLDNTSFPAMFKELEKSSQKLGIESMGVTVASMKDVYLKINLDWAPGGKEREAEVVGAFVMTFACLGPNIICFAYLMAERAESVGGAMSAMVLLVFVGGFASVIGYTVVEGLIGWNVVPAFMLFPPFAIIACLVKISQMENKATKCALVSAAAGARSVRMMEPPTSGVGAAYAPGYMATEQVPLQLVSDSCDVTTPFSFSGDGILLNLLFLMGEGLVFFAILSAILSGYSTGSRETVPLDKQGKVDEDVEEERRLVNRLRDNKDFGGHALVAWNLHKLFGPLHAVRGVHLSLRPAECFGLLGVNGAGKTTTFQMLAGLTTASHGDAYTEHATLSQNLRKWQSQISYCFQLGGLLDRLNAYEYLYLIGRLRGITEKDLKPAVDSVISVVDLKPHADKECGVYSGGNRRKLSIGAALLGLPPIVFLDEPYAGVDVVSRTKIFKAISLIKQKSRIAVMLTSHNMDECEISCDRLTIMVQGQMMCLGTLQHLRNKFGKGYRLEFMLKHEAGADAVRFKAAVLQLFPGIVLTDFHENVLSYHLEERIPWSSLFERVASLQKDFALEHAMVGDNTLEQIFIAFAKTEETRSTRTKPA